MKKIIAVSFISTFLVLLSFYAVNAIILEQQKNKQLEISNTLLQYSEGLSQSVATALKSVTAQGCDKASLDNYRKLKLDSLYFGDIGFIENGKIACTAFWGKLTTPVSLPSELHKTPKGFILAQFSQKISLPVMRRFTTTLLYSPHVMPTINLPPSPPATH
jgi:sensor c-di-GMP phosphodiesterase-like protein